MEPTAPAASSFDVSVTATLQRFRSYPNVTKAKLICAAAEFEQVDQPNATPIYRSPKRVALMGELQHINELATRLQQPSLKSELGQIAACQYLDSKQTGSPIPVQAQPKILFMKQSNDTVTEKQPNEREVRSNISVTKTIIHKRKNFPSFLKRASNKSKGEITYNCKVSSASNHWGSCKIKSVIIRLPTTEGGFDVQLQVATNEDCQCHLYTREVRGLSNEVFSNINTLVLSNLDLKPDQTKLKLIQQEMNSIRVQGPLFPVTTNKERLTVGKQIKNNIDYQKRAARKKGLIAGECTFVGDIVALKQSHLFSFCDSPIKNSPTELEIKNWGTTLFKSRQLNVFKTKAVTNVTENAYLCMTVLDPIPNDNDEGVTRREKEMGVYNLNTHGVKSFRPFFYILCVRERQECFAIGVLAFLKYCRLLFNITNIDFKGGAVSDHTAVFTNIYKIAFPNTKMVQCHIHLERKLWKGKGNGAYTKHADDKSFFYDTCRRDVHQLHHCLSQQQFDTLSKFVMEGWRHAVRQGKISKELATTLFDSYIKDPDFNQWYVSTGGLTGYDPTQQPTERAMEHMKGTKTFPGLLNTGRNMGTMIEVELPKMIVNVSTTCMGVESHTCLQEEKVILQTDSTVYKQLSLYYKFITDERIFDYYEALKGRTKETYQSRQKFCECVSSMCLVSGTRRDNKVIYTGSCVSYWKTRYCPHAAYFQYKNQLKSMAVVIPTNRMSNGIRYDRRCTPKTQLRDRYTSVAILIDIMKTLIFKKATLYESITKRMIHLPCVTTLLQELKDKNKHYCSERLDNANRCELLIINLNCRLRQWRGDQEKQEISYVSKQLQQISSCLRNT